MDTIHTGCIVLAFAVWAVCVCLQRRWRSTEPLSSPLSLIPFRVVQMSANTLTQLTFGPNYLISIKILYHLCYNEHEHNRGNTQWRLTIYEWEWILTWFDEHALCLHIFNCSETMLIVMPQKNLCGSSKDVHNVCGYLCVLASVGCLCAVCVFAHCTGVWREGYPLSINQTLYLCSRSRTAAHFPKFNIYKSNIVHYDDT